MQRLFMRSAERRIMRGDVQHSQYEQLLALHEHVPALFDRMQFGADCNFRIEKLRARRKWKQLHTKGGTSDRRAHPHRAYDVVLFPLNAITRWRYFGIGGGGAMRFKLSPPGA